MAKRKYPRRGALKKPRKVAEAAPKLLHGAAPGASSSDAPIETRVFRSGNSDAVRLPKSFGLLGKRVKVRRDGSRVIVELAEKSKWPPGFFDRFSDLDDDFEAPPREGPDPAYEERLRRLFDDSAAD